MGFQAVGVVASARPVVAEDNSYAFYALDLALGRGDRMACQVWEKALYETLLDSGEALVNHKVQVTVQNYSVGTRTLKDGSKVPQLRFRVSKVVDLGLPEHESVLVGTVTSARTIAADDGTYNFHAIDIVTGRGVTYACQVWDNDPQFVQLGAVLEGLVDHKVQVRLIGLSVGKRKLKDGTEQPQARFRITDVHDLGLSDADE
jgi:hypothetical protein